MAREVPIWKDAGMSAERHLEELLNPYARFPPEICNAWSLDLVAGDACAAYECLVATAGDREWVCWKSKTGLHCRKSGPSFIQLLRNNGKRLRK
jgi:hypothetical protein